MKDWRYQDLVYVMTQMGFTYNEIRAYVRVRFKLNITQNQCKNILKQKPSKGSLAHKYLFSNHKMNIQFLLTYARKIGRQVNFERIVLSKEKTRTIPRNEKEYKTVYGNKIISTNDSFEIKRIILEESIRIGSADSALMAENLIIRLQL